MTIYDLSARVKYPSGQPILRHRFRYDGVEWHLNSIREHSVWASTSQHKRGEPGHRSRVFLKTLEVEACDEPSQSELRVYRENDPVQTALRKLTREERAALNLPEPDQPNKT